MGFGSIQASAEADSWTSIRIELKLNRIYFTTFPRQIRDATSLPRPLLTLHRFPGPGARHDPVRKAP